MKTIARIGTYVGSQLEITLATLDLLTMWVVQMAVQDFFTQRQRAVEPAKVLRQRWWPCRGKFLPGTYLLRTIAKLSSIL